jgi:hypothetical protein
MVAIANLGRVLGPVAIALLELQLRGADGSWREGRRRAFAAAFQLW